jgi:hypothetical protein
MYCPKCGTQNESEYRFCMKCGTPLPESSSPPSSVESIVVPDQQQQDDFDQVATNDWSQPIYSPGAVPTPNRIQIKIKSPSNKNPMQDLSLLQDNRSSFQ